MPWITTKFPGKCAECGDEINILDRIYWSPPSDAKPKSQVYCATCGDDYEKADKEAAKTGSPKRRPVQGRLPIKP